MKIRLPLAISSWLLLVGLSQDLWAQAKNQILQAYVLQNKTVTQLEKDLSSKAKVMVTASRDLLELTEEQMSDLSLACQGDISRFMQDLTEVDLHTKDFDMQKMQQNQEEMQRIWPMVMPARQLLEQGLHGKESLYQKTLDSILSEEQQKTYENHHQQKLLRRMQAVTKLTLFEFEKKMPLTKKQRDRIIELVEKLPKPKKIDENMSYYLGMIVLAKLPKAELADILTEDQLKLFEKMTRNAQRFGGVNW
jgi:hypothetical protein